MAHDNCVDNAIKLYESQILADTLTMASSLTFGEEDMLDHISDFNDKSVGCASTADTGHQGELTGWSIERELHAYP